MFLLASHRMALAGERKNPKRIAREIEIFSIFAWLVPTLVPKHNSRIRVFRSTICWSWWSIIIYETFGAKKIAVSLRNLVSAPCSGTGPNLRTSLFVDCWLEITKLCTEESISVLKHNKSTLWDLEEEASGNGISTIGKRKFTIAQNEMVSFTCKDSIRSPECLAYWERSRFKGGSKSRRRPGFDAWQFAAQAEMCRYAEIEIL